MNRRTFLEVTTLGAGAAAIGCASGPSDAGARFFTKQSLAIDRPFG